MQESRTLLGTLSAAYRAKYLGRAVVGRLFTPPYATRRTALSLLENRYRYAS
jgi:hypothetical protein